MPRLSVVVPVYNVAPWMEEALDSLLAATVAEDAEILCVDDGSTDGSGAILDGYARRLPDRLRVIRQPNGGYGKAVNAGLDAVRGDYLAIFEPDDWAEPEAYAAPMALLDAHPEADLVRAPFLEWRAGKVRGTVRMSDPPAGVFDAYAHPPALLMTPAIWATVYRARTLNGLRLPETPGAGFQDAFLAAAPLLRGAKLIWSDRPFYRYRKDRPGASRAARTRTDEIFALFDAVREAVPEDRAAHPDFAALYHATYFLRMLWFMHRVAPGFQDEAVCIAFARFSPLWRDEAAQARVAALLTPYQRRVFARFARGRSDAFAQQFGRRAPIPERTTPPMDFNLRDVLEREVMSLGPFARIAASPAGPAFRAAAAPIFWGAAKALAAAAALRG